MKTELKPITIPFPARKIRYSHKTYDILSTTYPYLKIGEGKIHKRKEDYFLDTKLDLDFTALGNMVIHEGDLVDEFIIRKIWGREKINLVD